MKFELVDLILVGIACFWAISLLARLMNFYREQQMSEFRQEIQRERDRLQHEAEAQRQRDKAAAAAPPPNSLAERRMNRLKSTSEPSRPDSAAPDERRDSPQINTGDGTASPQSSTPASSTTATSTTQSSSARPAA